MMLELLDHPCCEGLRPFSSVSELKLQPVEVGVPGGRVLPGDTEPAGVSVHGRDRDVDRWIGLQDSITLKCLGCAGLAPSTVGDA